jgi:hypothetical protein
LNNILSTKTNALFLAVVLVAGTIALMSPSFIIGAQAQEYYGQDKSYKKSDGKNVSVKSIKCNNINVNVNGLELDGLPPFLGNLTSDGDADGYSGTGSYGSGESYGENDGNYGEKTSSDGDFKFICINNNNNTVVVEEEPPLPPVEEECPEADEIESCFRQFLLDALFPNFVDELESGITVEINGQEVTLNSFADICEALEGLTFLDLLEAVDTILSAAGISVGSDVITDIAECIEPVLAL